VACAPWAIQVNKEKGYAFAEFLTPEASASALQLDGIALQGVPLRSGAPRTTTPSQTQCR